MSSYEALRQKHVATAKALLPEYIKHITWPAGRLREAQLTSLRKLVKGAKEGSPWHRDRLAHIDVEQLGLEDLQALPVMTKEDLMSNFNQVVTDSRITLDRVESHLAGVSENTYLFDRYHVVTSGGSSGVRGVFVFDWNGWAINYIGYVRYVSWSRLKSNTLEDAQDVIGTVAAEKPTHSSNALPRTFSNKSTRISLIPVLWPAAKIVAELNRLQPTILQGYPSAMYLLAHEARAGRLRISPEAVMVAAEPLLPEIRAAIETTWQASVWNTYGTSEGGATASACGVGRGMHLNEDILIVEPVDLEGRPVSPGVRSSKIYLTNLYNFALPLIRYEITDEVTLLEEKCLCGSTHRRIDDIQGRYDECFTYYGRLIVHPVVFRSLFGPERNVVEYQVFQTARGARINIRSLGEVDIVRLEAKLIRELEKLGLENPDVRFTLVEQMERRVTGKLKRFFPLPEGAANSGES